MNSCSSHTLKTSHNKTAGFFSNCSVRLKQIIEFFNENQILPENIDSLAQFRNYKEEADDLVEDLTKYFFEQKPVPISGEKIKQIANPMQYGIYKNIDFKQVAILIETFFSPSKTIKDIVVSLENKYSLEHDNTCSVHYRGNDKAQETGIAEYEQFFSKAQEVLQKNANIKFLIQTDELEFAQAFKQKFSNSFFFEELTMINHDKHSSVHHSLPRNKRKEHASYFFAAIIIMSKTKHLITYSGNSALWITLYRRNAKNTHQYLKIKNWKTQELIRDFGWIS